MRVGLFTVGTSELVNDVHRSLASHGHQLAALVVTRYAGPGRPLSGAMLRRVADVDPSIPILVTNRLEPIASPLAAFDLDLILVWSFTRRLPPSILAVPRLGCVNVHPSWLPRYRGPYPLQWQLYNGEEELGVTCHRMDADFDTGPILLQWTMPIRPEENLQQVRRSLNAQMVLRLPELLCHVKAGAPGTAQDNIEASYAPIFTERERTIEWGRSAREIVNQIRAVGDAGATASLGGATYQIIRAEAVGGDGLASEARREGEPPGTVLQATDASLLIATGAGLLRALAFRAL